MKYVAQNPRGFANSWEVLAFADLKSAQLYVEKTYFGNRPINDQPRLIAKRNVGYWVANKPKPFSGEALIVVMEENAPYWGRVVVGHPDNGIGYRVFN
jgi:hypothetical protein